MRAATRSSAPPCSKGFQAFGASSACAASATSYHSCSAAPLSWPSAFSWAAPSSSQGAPFWPSGLTLRSSGLAFSQPLTLAVSLRKTRFIQPHVLFTGIYLFKRLFVGFWVSCRASPFGAAPVSNIFCKHCAASVAHCFFTVCARRQFGASRFGFWV